MSQGAPPRPGVLVASDPSPRSGLATYRCDASGPGSPTVLCVHGTLDGALSFRRVARRLDGVDVVAYDRRGYRASRGVPVAAGIDAQVDDLADVVALLDAPPDVVLGHSAGGVIALSAAARGMTEGAAVIAYEPPIPWLRDDPHPTAGELSEDAELEAERFFRRMVSHRSWERLDDARRRDILADGPALLEDLRVVRGPSCFDAADIDAVVTIAIGAKAEQRHRVSAQRLVAELRRGRLVEFDGAGHGAHLTHPDQLAALVVAALGARAEPEAPA